MNPFWAGAGGSIISGGASLIGGALGQSSSKDAAKNQRRFITKQMQNAHQWEVEDLRKAGLNPILSAGGPGARGGTMASPQFGDIVGPAVSTALQTKRLSQELKNMKAAETKDTRQGALFSAEYNTELEKTKAQQSYKNLLDTQAFGQQVTNAIGLLSIPREQAGAKFFMELDKNLEKAMPSALSGSGLQEWLAMYLKSKAGGR